MGWAAWAIGLGLFSTLDESDGIGKQIGYGVLAGFGVGQTLQPFVADCYLLCRITDIP